jgi:hydrogenase expression/formation protein HypC
MERQMCLAIPLKIISIDHLIATVDLYGAMREVSLLILPEEPNVGDYVLVHAGFAIQKVDKEAARNGLDLMKEIAKVIKGQDDLL